MFNFFKRQPKQMTTEEYQSEYRRLLRELNGQLAIGNSVWEQVVHSMGVIDHEMNGNGGVNWPDADYSEFMDALRSNLTSEKRFSAEQLERIRWSLDEIEACGLELEQKGESARNATEAVDYLILRVVDWCRMNPRQTDENQN
jgi:hypothetical protein